jgi:hypothetical protein
MSALGVDGMRILICTFTKYDGGEEWINVAQDKNKWRAYVSTVMNLRVI